MSLIAGLLPPMRFYIAVETKIYYTIDGQIFIIGFLYHRD